MGSNYPPVITVLSDSSQPSLQSAPGQRTTKRRSITELEYAEAIIFYSKQTIRDTLHPGSVFEDLARFLKNGTSYLAESEDKTVPERPWKPLATLHTIDDAGHSLSKYSDSSECAKMLEDGKSSMKCQILFLQGYPSPQWITMIGAFCRTDPEYFNAHLRFRCRRDYYSVPTLRSGAANIITLRFVTLGSREMRVGESDQDRVDTLRLEGERDMIRYKHDLMVGSSLEAGDSIVRSFSVLDEKNFFIEQELSICLHKYGQGWIILVSIDAGNDLSNGPQGPWLTEEDRRSLSPWTILAPTIQHSPKIWLRSNSPKAATFVDRQERFPQSAQLLAQLCGKSLDTPTMFRDPFYAITDLFQFCASSEVQFLNIMEAKIKEDTDHGSLKKHNPTLSNLLYCREIIQEHLTRLQETVKVIKRPGGHLWPHVGEDHPHEFKKANRARESLLEDYEHLVQRANALLERCSKGMDVIMSNVMLAESRRGMVQAQAVAKLTLIAFFFIPLSFTSSLFSMDFAGFQQGIGQIWLWFAVSVPVSVISILFLVLDRRKLRMVWLSLNAYWRGFGEAVQHSHSV